MNEDLVNLIIFAIIMAFGVIANMIKARSEKTDKTGEPASEDTAQARESHSQPPEAKEEPSRLEKILERIPKPVSEESSEDDNRDRRLRRKRPYTPGGFAEVMRRDRALEDTLQPTHKEKDKQATGHEAQASEAAPDAQAAEEELDSLFTDMVDDGIYDDIDMEAIVERLPISQERLPDAVIYSEILSKPLGLREDNEHIF